MNYKEAMDFIEDAKGIGSILGLSTMRELLNELDNPQDKLRFVHVAGTNGKGSTSAFTASILGCAGYKVGRYISPSVLCYEEKIQITSSIDGKLYHNYISKKSICEQLEKVKSACMLMTAKGLPHPTVFEIETTLSFLYFVEKQCDIVILEVGLGGRLDATNVVSTVLCSIITSISMDHMEFLGDTIEKIAYEKAGIVKANIPVVGYTQLNEVTKVIEEVAKKKDSFYREMDETLVTIQSMNIDGTIFSYGRYTDLNIRLLGEHQIYNSIVAILAIEELVSIGYKVSVEDIKHGLRSTIWRGRFEVVSKEPYFIVDGAHNEGASIELSKNIRRYFAGKRIIYIIGMLKDKDYKKVLENTGRYAEHIITITPNNSRGLDRNELRNVAMRYCEKVETEESVEAAVKISIQLASKEDVIITFGSLSFLNEIYSIFN